MAAHVTEDQARQFAAAYANTGEPMAAYRAIRPLTRSDSAALKGGQRMLARADVQALLKRANDVKEQAIANVRGHFTVIDQETERLTQTISISEIQLISEYVNNAMLDHLSYYSGGKPIPLEDLAPEQRRQIKRIVWDTADQEGKRKVLDYVLEERAEARSQLAKITGIVNPAFDFAGLLALMTGKKKEDAQEEIRRLNHSEGVNWESIQKKAGVLIDNKTGEVMP